ncbi:helix-turn-helix domain-containing protein [Methanobacterium spitsbergense]|uniref:ATP-binding protein n=1 Tax=Methanobacterium spitsbergense TaxID=2874285 RepID=A0A8T5UUE9_9EURY|nr:ATP-binding protein [Methanobacterium spitsbergense]MBZ2164483.1 ATP-binding protein [Methanobacterium spitsbergense]
MSKIKEIFGEGSGLNLLDIKNAINSDILHENDEIEFKDADRFINEEKSKLSKKKKKSNQINKIVSELVSFLNSGRGVGLLILGLEENDQIAIKGVTTLKDKEQIRNLIYKQIGTIPSNIKPFKLDIIPVPFDEGNIFLIEVGSNNLDGIYYSKLDNNVYIRRGDETKTLDIPSFLELLANKNHAKIFTKFQQHADKDSYSFGIKLYNEGLEPGRYIYNSINVVSNSNLNYSIEGSSIEKQRSSDIDLKNMKGFDLNMNEINVPVNGLDFGSKDKTIESSLNKFFTYDNFSISSFRNLAGYPPSSIFIYPQVTFSIGKLSIEKKDFKMVITINNYENRGHTKQIFLFQGDKNGITHKELLSEYNSYLNL